jgi:hypothetical protein
VVKSGRQVREKWEEESGGCHNMTFSEAIRISRMSKHTCIISGEMPCMKVEETEHSPHDTIHLRSVNGIRSNRDSVLLRHHKVMKENRVGWEDLMNTFLQTYMPAVYAVKEVRVCISKPPSNRDMPKIESILIRGVKTPLHAINFARVPITQASILYSLYHNFTIFQVGRAICLTERRK